MKRMEKILTFILAVIMLLTVCGTAGADEKARKIETAADAEEWVTALLGEHPEEQDGIWAMSAQMETAAARMGGTAGLAKQLSGLGAVQEIGSVREGEVQGYRAFYIPCVFQTMPVDLVLLVQEGAIAGLSTGAYTGGEEERTDPDDFDSIGLALPVPELGELPGILTVPRGEGPFPAVILLQGSGASDKDETLGNLKPFRDIAEGLAKHGVAVYRFDKRSYVYGTELAAKKDISLADEYLEDAVNAVQLLAEQERIDSGRIFVLGHSLGGNAIPAVAGELEQAPVKACGFIMMAASPRPLDELMREQYDYLYSLMPEVTEEQQAEKDMIFAELDKLKDPDSLGEDDTVVGVYSSYWKWLSEYDILQEAKEITEPVLLLQGEEDYQVTMVDFGMWKEAVGEKENWQLISYPGLTHVFMPGQKTEGSSVYTRDGEVDEKVISDIAGFVIRTGAD